MSWPIIMLLLGIGLVLAGAGASAEFSIYPTFTRAVVALGLLVAGTLLIAAAIIA